jgi:hypothetical protein
MKIYAYYQSISTGDQSEEFACANWWKTSWTANGWEPVMLNRSHAQGSPLYNKVQARIAQEIRENPELTAFAPWLNARFTRWCALHAARGGWMADYDVLNLGLAPEAAKMAAEGNTVLLNEGPAYLFYVTGDWCASAIRRFSGEELIRDGKIRSEADILGILPEIEELAENVAHVHKADGKSRSTLMKEMFETSCQPRETV